MSVNDSRHASALSWSSFAGHFYWMRSNIASCDWLKGCLFFRFVTLPFHSFAKIIKQSISGFVSQLATGSSVFHNQIDITSAFANCYRLQKISNLFLIFFHSLGSTKGYYLYMESSSPRKQNDTARISSITFRATSLFSNCRLRFWYHMFGDHVDTLNVHLRTSVGGPLKNIWNMTGKANENVFFLQCWV